MSARRGFGMVVALHLLGGVPAQKAGRANVLLFVYHDHHQAAVAVKIVPDSDNGDAPAKGKGKPK